MGDRVWVRAYKADGTCYRWWCATVEAVAADRVVVVTPTGHRIESTEGGWISEYAIRSFYWINRRYSLLEVYRPDGTLDEIFVNINSPVKIRDSEIRFTDYELDVTRKLPNRVRIVDQDELLEAASRYGYSKDFRQACYEVAREALAVANRWVAGGMPTA